MANYISRDQLNELLPKLRRIAAEVPFADEVVAMYFSLSDPETPHGARLAFAAAIAYTVSPLQIPGPLDNAIVFAMVSRLARKYVTDVHKNEAEALLREWAGKPPKAENSGNGLDQGEAEADSNSESDPNTN